MTDFQTKALLGVAYKGDIPDGVNACFPKGSASWVYGFDS